MANREKVEYTLSLRDAFSDKMNDANKSVDRFNKDAEKGTKRSEQFSEGLRNIAAAGAAIAGSLGIREVVRDLRKIGKVQTDVTSATGQTGDELRNVTGEVRQLAAATEENANSITTAANAVAENLGVSFEEALTKIEQGFKRGANLNGQFLQQLKEYPSALKRMNIGADQFFGIITQSANEGVFSDKGLDAIKEFQNSLGEVREEGSEVRKALTDLSGVSPEEVASLFDAGEGMEAIRRISQAIENLESEAEKRNVISKIFKGPGEDAGANFFEMMAEGTKQLSDLPEVLSPIQESFFEMDQAIVRVKNSIVQEFAPVFNLAVDLFQRFEPEIIAVVKALLLVGGAGGAIFAVIQGVNMLTAALVANPIGAIVSLVAALSAGLVVLYQKNEAFRSSVNNLFDGLKELLLPALKQLWQTIKNAFLPIWRQLKGLFEELRPLIDFLAKLIGGALFLSIKKIQITIKTFATGLNIIIGIVRDLIDGLRSLFDWFMKFTGLGDLFDGLKEKFEGIFDFSTIIDNVTDGLAFLGDKLSEFLDSVGMENTAGAIRSVVRDLRQNEDGDTEANPIVKDTEEMSVPEAGGNDGQTSGQRQQITKEDFPEMGGFSVDQNGELIEAVRSQKFNEDGIIEAIKDSDFRNENKIVEAIKSQKISRAEKMNFDDLGGSIISDEDGRAESESRSVSGSLSGSVSGGKKVTINISNLVENLSISASDLSESADRIRDEIARALTAAITDSSIANTN